MSIISFITKLTFLVNSNCVQYAYTHVGQRKNKLSFLKFYSLGEIKFFKCNAVFY